MEDKRERENDSEPSSARARAPYQRPRVVCLGSITELTQSAAGSVADSFKGAQSSSLRVKKDVAYLDDGARDEIARELLSLRLARWEYKDRPTGGFRPLGIIVEDAPEGTPILPTRDAVDLYSYASMAIAAAQVHAKQIEALRDEVAKLRRELAEIKKP